MHRILSISIAFLLLTLISCSKESVYGNYVTTQLNGKLWSTDRVGWEDTGSKFVIRGSETEEEYIEITVRKGEVGTFHDSDNIAEVRYYTEDLQYRNPIAGAFKINSNTRKLIEGTFDSVYVTSYTTGDTVFLNGGSFKFELPQ